MPDNNQTEAARLPRADLERLIRHSPAVHYVAAASGDYGATYVSPGIKRQLGYDPEQFTEDSAFWTDRVHPEDLPSVLADLEQLLDKGRHHSEYRFRQADGGYRWMHDEMALVLGDDGNSLEIIGSWLDVTVRKEAEFALAERNQQLEESRIQLERLAMYDQLTGLGNRNLFLEHLEHRVAVAGRTQGNVALFAMDLDGFKEINDRLGHAAGDAVLREIGARLRQSPSPVGQKYRIGGDEFAVLIELRSESLNTALAEAEKIARDLAAPMEIDGHGHSVGVSIGVAVFPLHGEDLNTLLRKADAAMYEAKKTDQVVAGASDLGATAVLERLHLDT